MRSEAAVSTATCTVVKVGIMLIMIKAPKVTGAMRVKITPMFSPSLSLLFPRRRSAGILLLLLPRGRTRPMPMVSAITPALTDDFPQCDHDGNSESEVQLKRLLIAADSLDIIGRLTCC